MRIVETVVVLLFWILVNDDNMCKRRLHTWGQIESYLECISSMKVSMLLPRQWGLGLGFGFFFLRSVTNRRLVSTAHGSLMHAYDTWNLQKLSSWKATSSDFMISKPMTSYTNEHTVRGTPTLTVVKRFRKGSVCKAYERSDRKSVV